MSNEMHNVENEIKSQAAFVPITTWGPVCAITVGVITFVATTILALMLHNVIPGVNAQTLGIWGQVGVYAGGAFSVISLAVGIAVAATVKYLENQESEIGGIGTQNDSAETSQTFRLHLQEAVQAKLTLAEEKATLQKQLDLLTQNNNELTQSINTQEGLVTKATELQKTAEASLTAATTQLNEKIRELNALNLDVQAKATELNNVKSELDGLKKSVGLLSDENKVKLENEIKGLITREETLKNEVIQQTELLDQAKLDLENSKKTLDVQNKDLEAAKQELINIAAQKQGLETNILKENESLTQLKSDTDAYVQKIAAEKQLKEAELETLKKEVIRVSEELEPLKTTSADVLNRNNVLAQEITKRENELKDMEIRKKELDVTIERLDKEGIDHKQALAEQAIELEKGKVVFEKQGVEQAIQTQRDAVSANSKHIDYYKREITETEKIEIKCQKTIDELTKAKEQHEINNKVKKFPQQQGLTTAIENSKKNTQFISECNDQLKICVERETQIKEAITKLEATKLELEQKIKGLNERLNPVVVIQ